MQNIAQSPMVRGIAAFYRLNKIEFFHFHFDNFVNEKPKKHAENILFTAD